MPHRTPMGFVSFASALVAVCALLCAPSSVRAQQDISDPDSYIVLGGQRLSVSSLTVRTGNMGTTLGNLVSRGVLTAETSTLVADTVKVAATSICGGVVAGQAVGTSESCPASTGVPVPALPDLHEACGYPAALPACNTAAPPVILEAGNETTLPPGTYGEVRLTGGSPGFATLRLNGTYTFCNVRALARSRILFNGPSTLYVNGRLILRNGFFGPDPSIPIDQRTNPRDIRVFATGPVGLTRGGQLKANVCAPDSVIRGTAVSITGRIISRRVRLRRCVLGLTDLPATCGNDIREGEEQCDPGQTGGVFVGGECGFCTEACTCEHVSTTTSTSLATTSTTSSSSSTVTSVTNTSLTTSSTSTSSSTTSTSFQPGVCGNGLREGDEECDGDDFDDATCPGSATGAFLVCSEACTIDYSECPLSGNEECGNCLDDDENGLTDYEDPACCVGPQRFPMVLKKGAISRNVKKKQTKLKLRSVLAMSGLTDVDPTKDDVFIQLRDPAGVSLLCAHIPAAQFRVRKNGKSFKFRDRDGKLVTAAGIRRVNVKKAKDGSLQLRARGKGVPFELPTAGAIEITTAFVPSEGEARCSAARRPFRSGKRGKLVFP